MTYSGGFQSQISALRHPSHLALRDCVSARHSAASATRSCGVDVILATLDGKAAASLADSFPITHSGIVAPPDASPRRSVKKRAIVDLCNTPFARVVITSPQTQRRPSSPSVGGAVEPGPLPPVVAGLTPQTAKTGTLGPGSLLPISRRQPSKGRGCVSVLREGRSFAALGSPQVFTTTDPHSPSKAIEDHVAHLSRPVLETARCGPSSVQPQCT